MIFPTQHFEADFLWKVSLKILNSGIILKTLTHGLLKEHYDNSKHPDEMLQNAAFHPDLHPLLR